MEKDKLEMLLEKYWKAETTVEQEKLIKAYLSNQAADNTHQEDQIWFKAIEDLKETRHDNVHFSIDQKNKKTRPLAYRMVLKMAAITILVSGLTWLGVDYNQKLKDQNQALARINAEASLMSMSNALNQAYEHLNKPTGLPNQVKTQN